MYSSIPYMMSNPALSYAPAGGLKSLTGGLLSKINWSSFLTNTQKTLSVVNQAIPLYHQVRPMINNIRMIGKIGKEFTKLGNTTNSRNINNFENNSNNNINSENTNVQMEIPIPKFFI